MSTEVNLREGDTIYVKKRGGGERAIKPGKWWINRNTPVGDDADLWELKPHDGKKYISWNDVIRTQSAKHHE